MKRYSIIQDDMTRCYVCGTRYNIHIHEAIYGVNRQNSIKYGLCIALCGKHHNLSNEGIHFNKELDNKIKQIAQTKFEETYKDLDFVSIFRKSYKNGR